MIYDLAVVGCGGMGSAVLYHAARKGAQVLGIEQFQPVHDRGSSHGQTRIIRQAYFEHPHYVPLLLEAYDLWAELERVHGSPLFVQTGLLQAGPADGVIVPGVIRSADEHHLPITTMDANAAAARFPMFKIPHDHIAAFEPKAGYLLVERCVAAHLRAAQDCGAQLITETEFIGYEAEDDCICVRTNRGDYRARKIVMTVGAWLPRWLDASSARLRVLRKHLHWFASSDSRTNLSNGCPLFFFEATSGHFYGFPSIDARGIKVAEHSGGEVIHDPTSLDRSLDPHDLERVKNFLAQYFHGDNQHQHHVACMYTMTEDEHFIIDTHDDDHRIWLAGGFSGHGFKFASVIGRLVATAALDQQADPRLQFLQLSRFQRSN